MWGLTHFVLYTISLEYQHFVKVRKKYISNRGGYRKNLTSFSLMIENIPKELQNDSALKNYFTRIFGNKVQSAHVVLNLSHLHQISKRRQRTVEALEKVVVFRCNTGKNYYTTHISGCKSTRVQALALYRNTLEDQNRQMKSLQRKHAAIADLNYSDDDQVGLWMTKTLGPSDFRKSEETATTFFGSDSSRSLFLLSRRVSEDSRKKSRVSNQKYVGNILRDLMGRLGFRFLYSKLKGLKSDIGKAFI